MHLTNRSKQLLKILGLAILGSTSLSSPVLADSHAFITANRSSTANTIYFQEGIDSEFGHYRLSHDDGTVSTEAWLGTNLSTSIGTEVWKFIQLEAGYGAINLHKSSDKLDRLSGSRLHSGLRLDFTAPLFNLELGGGFQASTLDYANHEETATFYGTGTYVSLGMNYFLTTHLSVYSEVKYTTEHMKNTGGSGSIDAIGTNSTEGGLGFRIWF